MALTLKGLILQVFWQPLFFDNPLLSSAIGSSLEWSIDQQFGHNFFTNKGAEELGLDAFFGAISGKFPDKATKGFLKNGKITSEGSIFLTSFILNMGISYLFSGCRPH